MMYRVNWVPAGGCFHEMTEEMPLAAAIELVEKIHRMDGFAGNGCYLFNVETGKNEYEYEICFYTNRGRWVDLTVIHFIEDWGEYLRNQAEIRESYKRG